MVLSVLRVLGASWLDGLALLLRITPIANVGGQKGIIPLDQIGMEWWDFCLFL